MQPFGVGADVGIGIVEQQAFGLEAFHGHDVGDQQNVGLRCARFQFGAEPRHDLRGAVAHPIDSDVGIFGHEGVSGLLRIGLRLAGIENQAAFLGEAGGNGGQQQAGGDDDAHVCLQQWARTSKIARRRSGAFRPAR